MAITPRTIITNPAAAAVAAWTVLGVSLMVNDGMERPTVAPTGCSERAPITEYDYLSKMQCLSDHGHHKQAAKVGHVGVQAFPLSESIHNQLGITYIQLGQYGNAVVGLSRALEYIQPSNATMENNLVWASLWTRADVAEQRTLYRRALAKEPRLCEAIHTGMMVEWRAAKHRQAFEKAEAIAAFASLADRYETCLRGSERTPFESRRRPQRCNSPGRDRPYARHLVQPADLQTSDRSVEHGH
ncbi:MAG: tetratricopeptide repeat protein [bacterium]